MSWLTYSEAAAALGTTPDAVRIAARRGKWAKQRPNRGGQPARVQVPESVLSASRPPLPEQEPDTTPEHDPDGVNTVLKAHIADLQAQLTLAVEREARDAALIGFLTGQIERLQAAAPKKRWMIRWPWS